MKKYSLDNVCTGDHKADNVNSRIMEVADNIAEQLTEKECKLNNIVCYHQEFILSFSKQNNNIMRYSNTYTDDQNYTHIDYWETEDENDENGKTIAIVCRDTKKVFYIDNSFRMDSMCKEYINEVLKTI